MSPNRLGYGFELLLIGLAAAVLLMAVAIAVTCFASKALWAVVLGIVLLGVTGLIGRVVWRAGWMLTAGRWKGTVSFSPAGVVCDCPAMLVEPWAIDARDIAWVRVFLDDGLVAPHKELAAQPEDLKSVDGWRRASATPLGLRTLSVGFRAPLTPPARWRTMAPTYRLTRSTKRSIRRGEPCTAIEVGIYCNRQEARAALSALDAAS